jgi:hypothetical protein
VEAFRRRSPEARLCAAKGKGGSGRSFFNPSRNPNFVTFREPHPGENVRPTMLRKYLSKLGVAPDEFIQLLEDC